MKRLYLIVIAVLVLGLTAHAINLNVYCGQKKRLPNSITAALKLINPAGPNTLTISGTCKENVAIQGFNRLTLISTTGATINDASGGTGFVVDIDDSTDIVLNGFTINGGVFGVACWDFSVCRFNGNTIQGASAGGISVNIKSQATLGSNTIQNNGQGIVVEGGSFVRSWGGNVIQNNLLDAVTVDTAGSFESFGDTLQNNVGSGMSSFHGDLLLIGTTVTGNGGYGVVVVEQSHVDIWFNNVITGNGISGVLLRDLSYAEIDGANTIIGNGSGTDVECQDYFTVVRGVTNIGGGTTNCTNASAPQSSGLHRPSLNRAQPPSH